MNSRNFSEKIYLSGLLLLAVALPFSNLLMSIAQFVLAGAWLAGGDYALKFRRFVHNKPALIFCLFYALHLFGLLYTVDFFAGLNDLKIKLPLLVLPFVVAGMPSLSEKEMKLLLLFFVAGVFTNTMLVSAERNWLQISPIRFSMMAGFSVFIIFRLLQSEKDNFKKTVLLCALVWLLFFVVKWPYETGIVTLAGGLFFTLAELALRARSRAVQLSLFSALALLPVVIFAFIYSGIKDFYGDTAKNTALEKVTAHGEAYEHNLSRKDIENGNYVWQYIAWTELEQTWNKRSTLAFNGKDNSGQPLSITLIRFLTSKGLRKDAGGVEQLSDSEIKAIEGGTANVRYMNGLSLADRLYETIWSVYHYRMGNNPQGNSVTQRFEFWKAGWSAFLQSPVFGYGTGSLKKIMKEQYAILKTPLDEKHRLKTHNQYLGSAVALGSVGLLGLLIAFLFPLTTMRSHTGYLGWVFFLTVMLAMLVEDTLETQAGATFAAFFYSLLLLGKRKISDSAE